MAFAVVHMQKIKASGVRGIQSHINREHPPKTNPDIDESRTAENYDIVYENNFYKAVKGAIEHFATKTTTVRKDAVVMCSFIVTSDEKTMKAMSPEQQRNFFEDSLQWFADRYGGESIVYATVHMDETTPHMHIGVVPITDERLSAKTLFDRKELTTIQTKFAYDVGLKYGLERGIKDSNRKHQSEIQFKIATATQEVQQENKALDELKEQKQAMQSEVSTLRGNLARLRQEAAILDEAIKKKDHDGVATFGMNEWESRIAAARKTTNETSRIALLEKFVSYPQVAPVFKKFCDAATQTMEHKKERNERSDR